MTTYKLVITGPARQDIKDIKTYTRREFGAQAAANYDALIKQALKDVRDNPYGPGSKARPEIHSEVRSYHISLSKARANSPVKSPRHLVLYFEASDEGAIAISRILHEVRDLSRHMPDEHKQAMERGVVPSRDKPGRGGRER